MKVHFESKVISPEEDEILISEKTCDKLDKIARAMDLSYFCIQAEYEKFIKHAINIEHFEEYLRR